jgi:hypothetical protein
MHWKRRHRGLGKLTPIEYETIIDPQVALAAQTNESTKPAAVPPHSRRLMAALNILRLERIAGSATCRSCGTAPPALTSTQREVSVNEFIFRNRRGR